MVPMVFATGMGIDYSRAAKLRTKLNALADAAALSAVTRPMMDKSSTYAKQIATNTFSAQAASLSGAEVSKLIITVTDPANIKIGEHTSELQSLLRISYAVLCLKKKKHKSIHPTHEIANQTRNPT